MARGAEAKTRVVDMIKEAFGKDFIGEIDKKVYVWAQEGGERIQVALTLTCPKTAVTVATGGDYNFEDEATAVVPGATYQKPTEITEEEKKNLAELMAKLGL